MLDIASKAKIEAKALIGYIIRGINDEGANKGILYGANDRYELKQRLRSRNAGKQKYQIRQTKK